MSDLVKPPGFAHMLTVAVWLAVFAPGLQAQQRDGCLPAHLSPSGSPGRETPAFTVSPAGRLCVALPKGGREGEAGAQGVTPADIPPVKAFLYSALLPGAGQHLLGQGRWTPYVAAELWGWVQYFLRRDRGEDLRGRYHDLAWEVARRVSVGSREDGDFSYYEALIRFQSSGAFDRNPLAAGIQPETDPDTFNGSVWELAGEIFFPPDAEEPAPGSPAYERALEYYLERSVSPGFAWDWADNSLQKSAYVNLIRESDEEFRSSTTMIGLILANHFVSAIDALVSARLRDLGRDPEEFSFKPLPLDPLGRWGFYIRIRH